LTDTRAPEYNRGAAVIDSEAFELAECQVVVFTHNFHISATAVVGALFGLKEVKYDGDPIILPPNQQSPEVPHIILTS
jgi:hypothetical protein